jgi:hypothetical protein
MVSGKGAAEELPQQTIETLARAAGLERCWAHYRDEVVAAAREAARRREALLLLDATAESGAAGSVTAVYTPGATLDA